MVYYQVAGISGFDLAQQGFGFLKPQAHYFFVSLACAGSEFEPVGREEQLAA